MSLVPSIGSCAVAMADGMRLSRTWLPLPVALCVHFDVARERGALSGGGGWSLVLLP
jgi:hypothetical protein